MEIFSTIKLVIRNLLSRKGRSFLTILGIVIGVAGVIIIMALGAGAQSLVLSQVTKLGSNLLMIIPGKTDEAGPPAATYGVTITTLVKEDAEALRNKSRFPYIEGVASFAQGTDTIIWGNKDIDTNYVGTDASYIKIQDIEMERGRFYSEREGRGGANVMVLGYTVWKDLFEGQNPIGEVVKIKSVPFEIIGVVKKRGSVAFQNQDDQVFIPLVIAQKQLIGINYVQSIRIKVDSSENVPMTISEIKQALSERHRIKDPKNIDFTVRNQADAISILSSITNAMTIFLTAMAAISLLVGGIGIMNIMMVTVAERTREVGLRKAVGATSSGIRDQFLLEAGTLTVLGGLIGIIFGIFVSYSVAVLARALGYDWAFVISLNSIILAVGVSILIGIIFGLYPAIKASKLNPIDALRYE